MIHIFIDYLDQPDVTPLSISKSGMINSTTPCGSAIASEISSYPTFSLNDSPDHPMGSTLAVQIIVRKKDGKPKVLSFQDQWYSEFSWLHFHSGLQKFVCFDCCRAQQMGFLSLVKYKEKTFVTSGFSGNWNNAIAKFREHQQSEMHLAALSNMKMKGVCVLSQLSTVSEQQCASNREALKRIAAAVLLCGTTGIALRGHDHSSGNFNAVLELLRKEVPQLDSFLSREDKRNKFTSWQIQNELLRDMAHCVQRQLVKKINSSKFFSVMVDETTDVVGREQVTICIRYVPANLEPEECFLAMQDTSSTTGQTLANLILECLQQFGLPISMLRGQCYDGGANMSGTIKGVQARILEINPLALYVHCVAHNLNLVLQDASKKVTIVRDALQIVHETGKLISESAHRRAILKEAAVELNVEDCSVPKPLCQTRWVSRSKPMNEMCQPQKYEIVMSTLEKISTSPSSSESGAKSSGLLAQLEKASTYLGISMCESVFSKTEILSKTLQAENMTVVGAKAAADVVVTCLQVRATHFSLQNVGLSDELKFKNTLIKILPMF